MKRIFAFLCLMLLPLFTGAQNAKTYIHPRAEALMPSIRTEMALYAPEITTPWYLPGLIEHESCVTLKRAKCWSSTAELRNNREHGVGLGQTTRAWDKNGKLRFDNLTIMKKRYPNELGELSWNTFKQRSDLQIRITVLMVKEAYRDLGGVQDTHERLKMADSAYNGGISHVKKARQVCQLSKDCDPQIWFQHTERYLPKSKTPDSRYGGRSMYEINTHHVRDVFLTRMPKFKQFWE